MKFITKKIKKIQLFLFLLCFTLTIGVIHAQDPVTYTGSGTLTTQADVTDLGTAMDAVEGTVTVFIGNITINEDTGSTDPITDLSIFKNITEIRGFFSVAATKKLTVLSHEVTGESGTYAFGALETISRYFVIGNSADTTTTLTSIGRFTKLRSTITEGFDIRNNPALTTIDAETFPALETIGGAFSIRNNDMLSTLSGFAALKTTTAKFAINSNEILPNTGDYPALTTVGDTFEIGGGTEASSNDALTAIGDFSALTTINGAMTIGFNPLLTDLGDFSALTFVNESISIQNNDALSDCSDFPTRAINSVENAGRTVTISNNASGCSSVTLTTQAQVTALGTTLGDATLFIGDITIKDSTSSTDPITDLSALRNITEIRGNFDVIFTKSLDTLSHEIEGENGEYAFGALETISGYFYLGPNNLSTTAVANIGNFPNLRSIGGNFLIRHNGFLTRVDIENFPVLRTIGGMFSIGTNHALTTIAGFPVLRTIGGKLSIANHNTLTSLGDFSSLIAIGGNFRIGDISSENDVLTTLGDFSSLGSIGGNITIEHNPMLNDCSSLPTRAINSVVNAGRNISIHTNAGGCSSVTLKNQAEVDAFGTALGEATVFTGTITIRDSTSSTDPINDLSAFSNITEIRGNFDVISTKSLTTLSHETSAGSGEYAFNALETITGNFHVGSFDNTTSFTNTGNFPNLKNIGGNFLINYNDSLTTIDADNFPALATVGKIFSINE